MVFMTPWPCSPCAGVVCNMLRILQLDSRSAVASGFVHRPSFMNMLTRFESLASYSDDF